MAFYGQEGGLEDPICLLNQKHPILLPGNHKISAMIIQEVHISNLHARPLVSPDNDIETLHALIPSNFLIGEKLNFLPDEAANERYPRGGRDFGKCGTMSTCIPSNKELSGGRLKRISKLETWSS
ncbi:hypothetical protein CEXT_148471 [Caerostris extrusa]|uniref:Uncharacterized protein n=1 Tax=Caerostris extrusa TaxID=172846 RepID=A0AAV4X967_CAEEX|nr:hypothetical protein CEXT_148471 [Caerostris extrusa]